MKMIVIALLSLVLIAGLASSQSPAYEKPVSQQLDDNSYQCHRLMVENLYAATNPREPLQQQYLLAAQAYRELSEAGQKC